MRAIPAIFLMLGHVAVLRAQAPARYFLSFYSGAAGTRIWVKDPQPALGITFGRVINNGLDLQADASEQELAEGNIYQAALLFKLKMNDGHILPATFPVAPYFFSGLSYDAMALDGQPRKQALFIPLALGINCRLASDLSLRFHTACLLPLQKEVTTLFEHCIGLQWCW